MNDIAGGKPEISRFRRPRVESVIQREPYQFMNTSNVELRLTRAGIEVCGYYDGHVGIQGFRMTWAEFDAERAALR